MTGYAQVVEELQNNQVVKTYTYGLDLISQRQSSGVSFYNYDGHGSVRSLSNSGGNITDTYDYDTFGTIINRTGTTDNRYLYSGEQFDADLNFYYNRARYLNVETGRFISQDSYEGNSNDPRSLHKYIYGKNDGVNRIDPSGYNSIAEVSISINVNNILSSMSSILAVAAVAAVACAVEAGVTNTLNNELDADVGTLTPCGVKGPKDYVRFVHGTSMVSAISINTLGVDYDALLGSASTGTMAPGFFFTFLLEPDPVEAFDLAFLFSQFKAGPGQRALVVGKLPRKTFNRLKAANFVLSEKLVGTNYDQTMFLPQSFSALNYHNRGKWEIIPK